MTFLPTLNRNSNLAHYLSEIQKFPMLEENEEYILAKEWQEKGDKQAAHKLVTSHLRLVAKIALSYKGYGLPVSDLISEGNVGMMQAVKKFDPDKGFRLATYAMWWIRAAIQEYILHSWSLVKIGTTAAQKKLFFNLRKLKNQIEAIDEKDLTPEQVRFIADQLDVTDQDVIQMNQRLAAIDHSLNTPIKSEGDGLLQWQDWLEDKRLNPEENFAKEEEYLMRQDILSEALQTLNEREREIFIARKIKDPAETLEELSKIHKVSRERIRQIEVRAFEKIQKYIEEKLAASAKALPYYEK